MTKNNQTARLRKFFSDQEQDMFTLLERLVNINSYTENKAGTDAVADIIQKECEAMGLTVRREARENIGDNLVVETQARTAGNKGVLLCGHMDTVFPPELGFNSFTEKEGIFYGPGVADMKSGLVSGIFALKALAALGKLQDMPIAFICNSDEETGSAQSSELITKEARKSDVAFVLEGAGDNGELVVGRKGRFTFELAITGKAGHAGRAKPDKASAILELARQVQAVEALNNSEAGTSVNVGKISGGVGPNTIAEHASAIIESRFMDTEAEKNMRDAVEQLAATPQTSGTSCTLRYITMRPPMVTTDAILELYTRVHAIGERLSIPVASMHRGGGSDANFIAQTGTPVIDGLGPIGGKLHSTDEYLYANSFAERTLLATEAILMAYETYCS